MTQMEELFKKCYKEGMYWDDFLRDLSAETYRVSRINRDGELTQQTQGIYERCKMGKMNHSLTYNLRSLYGMRRTVSVASGAKDFDSEVKMLKALQDDSLMDLEDQKSGGKMSGKKLEDMGDSFLHRLPKIRYQEDWHLWNKTYGRFSISAEMNPQMIKELDEFCTRHRCMYKTSYPSEWNKRVDPVNVYLKEPITEELKKEFVSIMQKYVRRDRTDINELLDGDVLSPGITCAKEYTVQEDIDFIRSLPPELQKDAFAFAGGSMDVNNTRMSLGQRATLEEFYKLYKQCTFSFGNNSKTVLMSTPTLKAEDSVVATPEKADTQQSFLQKRLAIYGQKVLKDTDQKMDDFAVRKKIAEKTTDLL